MRRSYVIFILLLALLTACNQRPDYVLSDKAMEDLLIDIHKTEAVMAVNPNKYRNSDSKRAMRQAVFMRHNTSQAEFDSSLVWYGAHLDDYMDIYERVIIRLESENEMIKDLIAQDNSQTLTRAGDTVDIWKQEKYHIFSADNGSNVMSFNITTDENFKRNDHFLFQFFIHNMPKSGEPVQIYLAIRHNNQVIHYNYAEVKRNGWNIVKVQSDSTANLSEIYGYIAMPPRYGRHIMYADSINLIRIHDKPGMPRNEYQTIDVNPPKPQKEEKGKDKGKSKPKKPNLLNKNLRLNRQTIDN